MICPDCNSDTTLQEQVHSIIKEKQIPFVCPSCGMIKMPIRATLDRVFVWADPVEDKMGKEKLLHMPEIVKENYKTVYGTVLSVGPGYYDMMRRNRYIPTIVKKGDRIAYDKDVLYRLTVRDNEGKKHKIALMGHEDVYGCTV